MSRSFTTRRKFKRKTCLYSHTNRFLKPRKGSLASESCRRRTRTADLMPVCRSKPTSDCALPTELHGIPYIFIHHTSSWKPHQPTTYAQSPSALLDLQSGFRISIRSACCCVTATIQPSIPTTSLGLTLLPICSVCCCVTATIMHQPVMLSDSEITAHACFLFCGRTHSPLSCCLFPRHP